MLGYCGSAAQASREGSIDWLCLPRLQVPSRQFLSACEGNGILLDPGRTLACNDLHMAIARFLAPKRLRCVLASHADLARVLNTAEALPSQCFSISVAPMSASAAWASCDFLPGVTLTTMTAPPGGTGSA